MPTKKPAPTAKKPSKQPARPNKTEAQAAGNRSKPSKASKATSKPSKETSKPSKETGKPAKEASKPAKEASKPAKETSKPAKEASKPSKPAKEASKPSKETSKPAKEASKPSKAASKPAAGAAESAAPERSYTLEGLVARLGVASEAEVQRIVLTPAEDLVALGATVSTERIDTDSARLYGLATDFYQQATPAQKQALLGLSADLLRVAVWAAQRGSELYKARRGELLAQAGGKEAEEAEAETVRRRAKGRREQLRAALLLCTGGVPSRRSEILSAYGLLGEKSEALGESLRRLARLARSYLDSRDPNLKARAAATGLSVPLLNDTFALAGRTDELRTVAGAPRAAVSVSQREVDRWDGINLTLLTHLLDVFDAGRLVDPSIPRLVPLSLRGFFSPPSRTSKKRPDEPGGPSA